MSNLWIRVGYAIVFALVVALTAAFGVSMVYSGPKAPDTPTLTFAQLQGGGDNQQAADTIVKTVDRFYQDAYDYRRSYPDYQRNLFLAYGAFAIVFAAIGIGLPMAVNYLRLGLTLAAIMLLLFGLAAVLAPVPNPAPTNSASITNLLAAGRPPGLAFAGRFLQFAVSFIGLLVLLFMGLWRLTDWAPRRIAIQAPTSSGGTPAFAHATTADFGTSPASSAEFGPATTVPVAPQPEQLRWKRPEGE
ncbi:MAG: hypothetical protein ACR2PL_12815 [Dehalococcoidia bacterium]